MSYIYFLQAGDHIKIGTTTKHPVHRLKCLQTGCPQPIKLLGVIKGSIAQERKIHSVLSHWRIRGEWFEPHPIVMAAVNEAIKCGSKVDIDFKSPMDHGRYPDVAAVVDALGGTGAVAKLTRAPSLSSVSNWKKLGRFPAKTFTTMQVALKERGLKASSNLWGMQ